MESELDIKVLTNKDGTPYLSDITKGIKDSLIKDIEEKVIDWLKKNNASLILRLSFKDNNGKLIPVEYAQFEKSIINIKTCHNGWDVWRIAIAHNWPRIISYKVKSVIMNNILDVDNIEIKNEIKTENYGGENK
jgi:hypothetical protein